METVKDAGEFGCIARLTHDLIYRPEFVIIGAGDDGAVYTIPPGTDQVISTDTMVEGLHFTAETMSARDVGWRICAVNFSDMAAMGARPLHFVIAAALPEDLPLPWAEECYDGIRDCCKAYSVNILGGDTTGSASGVVLTGTVVGFAPKDTAVPRSGAKPGDIVFVTGTVGDSAAGLFAILHHRGKDFPTLAERHRRPEPRISFGEILREARAHALDDISDGLSRESHEIADASGVTLEIDAEKIPISEEARRLADEFGKDPVDWALTGGEDFELVGTMREEDFLKVKERIPISKIGRVTAGPGGVFLIKDGRKSALAAKGYEHFSRKGG